MQQYPSSNATLLVVNRGEEVIAKLTDFAHQHPLKSAWVSGLGGAGSAILGLYDLDTRDYSWSNFDGPLEIVDLVGNLSWVDGEPFWHVHSKLSSRDLQAVGGHVKELRVALTCELLITPLDNPLSRKYDKDTGLKLLSDS